jgi:hypothetical protein
MQGGVGAGRESFPATRFLWPIEGAGLSNADEGSDPSESSDASVTGLSGFDGSRSRMRYARCAA